MAYTDLRDFIRALEKRKQLRRITEPIDPVLEITEFADRAVKSGGPALLFENPVGSKIPALLNAFASDERMRIALEVDSLDDIAARIVIEDDTGLVFIAFLNCRVAEQDAQHINFLVISHFH